MNEESNKRTDSELLYILKDLLKNLEGFLDIPPEDRDEAETYGIIHYAKKRVTCLIELESQKK